MNFYTKVNLQLRTRLVQKIEEKQRMQQLVNSIKKDIPNDLTRVPRVAIEVHESKIGTSNHEAERHDP